LNSSNHSKKASQNNTHKHLVNSKENTMHLMALPDFVRESAPYAKLLASLQAEQSVASWQVVRAARPYVLAAIARDWQAPIVYITGRGKRAYNVAEQLPVWLGEAQSERILRYAEPTPMFYDHLPWDREVINERIGVLDALSHYEAGTPAPVIIASARALMQTTLAPRQFRQASFSISVGDIITPDTMLKRWLSMGYEASPMVTETGQFSRRGGILDVFPMASRHPIRIEFFGDEVETLRTFSPSTQRTVENVQTIRIVPAREALPQDLPRATKHLETFFASHSDDEVNTWQQDMEALANGQAFPYLEYYLPYAQPNPVSLLDYVTDDTLIIVEDYDDFMNVVQTLTDDAIANRENNFKTQQLPEDYPMPYVSASLLAQDLERQRRLFLTLQADVHVDNDESPRIFKPGGRWGGQLRPFLADVRKLTQAGDRAIIVSQQVERLTQLWQDEDVSEFVPRVKQVGDMPDVGSLRFVEGSLGEGWTLTHDEGTLHIFTDAEIFNWSRPEPRRRKKTNTQQRRQSPEADYADWKEGNYVVHVDFGIGEFKGLKTRTVEGNEREYLLVEYAGTDTLFVPIHQADRLTRYVGADERPPKLNKLGKPIEWVRTREKARKAAEEEAHELLEIYARRANSSGFGYQPDTPWQRELEASFPYVETDDQLRALREVKGDMQQTMPMDRLVCGDVGYGKTEVALRAAFKAVMDGKQVAILVPTTVLADQHYRTFSRRMAPFPLKVELLSRFRTKAQQAKAVDLLAEGKIDIIIGTHRLLSQDVAFKNLGLVIIDEEQRFGVKAQGTLQEVPR
jgi:transcription-repair coupling factor (superfamily II helicase)